MKMLTVASASPFEDLEQQSSPRDSKATFVSPAPLNQLDIDSLETLPVVVALGPEKLELVTVEVGDDDDTARPQNPRHLANCPRRFFDVMEKHVREDIVDRLVFDRDPFGASYSAFDTRRVSSSSARRASFPIRRPR